MQMMQMTFRGALALAGTAGVVLVTTRYYAEAVEWLARLEKLAHAAIPAVLAVALLYRVLKLLEGEHK